MVSPVSDPEPVTVTRVQPAVLPTDGETEVTIGLKELPCVTVKVVGPKSELKKFESISRMVAPAVNETAVWLPLPQSSAGLSVFWPTFGGFDRQSPVVAYGPQLGPV